MKILMFIQEYIRCPLLTDFFVFITRLGDSGIIWIFATIILLCIPKTRSVGIMSAMALTLSLIINNGVIKNLVCRTRPYDAVSDLKLIIERQHDYSFPSGHTASSFVSATVFFRNLPKYIGIPALVLACLIAISRLYVGVHYPSDVIAGVVSGIFLAVIAEFIYKHISIKSKNTKSNNNKSKNNPSDSYYA